MSCIIDIGVFKENLSKAKQRNDVSEYMLKEPPEDLPDNLRYLIDNILDPLRQDQNVHTGDIDFSKFNRNDIADLYDYYIEHIYDGTADWYKLKSVYDVCKKTASQSVPVRYI